jgi:hypothetical protein
VPSQSASPFRDFVEEARDYVGAVRPFLRSRASPDGLALDLSDLTAGDVIAFVVARCTIGTMLGLKIIIGFDEGVP